MMDRPIVRRRRVWKVVFFTWLMVTLVSLTAGGVRASRQQDKLPVHNAGHALNRVQIPQGQAAVQVYAARTWGAKKAAAVHTWVATKRMHESQFTVHEVIGWYSYRGGTPLVSRVRQPDRPWYGSPAIRLVDIRGKGTHAIIDDIEKAMANYPYAQDYRAWPGPNSNTFTAWIGRRVPAIKMDLPSTAIGKDYGVWVGPTTSGSGLQISVAGVLSLAVGAEVGLEFNALALNYELDLLDLGLEFPGYGRLDLQ